MTQEEIRAVAEGLTKAQRWCLGSEVYHAFGETMVRTLWRKGLLIDASLTPLGLAVRAYLQSQEKQ